MCGWSLSLFSDGTILAIGARRNDENGIDSGHARVFSIASELALREVIENIAGNSNGIKVTAEQLNAIIGFSGAIDGVNYTTALQNSTFGDPNNPAALEIQAVIDQVNATLSLDENKQFRFKKYPNPTKNQFTIELENSADLQNVTIYNNLDQLVLTTNEMILNTSKLA